MKQVFVQKIVDGLPKGRKRKLEIAQDEIVFDLLEKASGILNFPEDRRLIAECGEEVLDEVASLNHVAEYSTFFVSEEQEAETTVIASGLNNNASKLTRTLFLQQRGIEKKVEMSLEACIFDLKDKARELFTINQECCVTIMDEQKEVLLAGKKIKAIPDFSTLTLMLEKDSQQESQVDENIAKPEENSPLRRPGTQWSEQEVEELRILKLKVLDFYKGKGWLPNGVSIEIVDYEDNKGTRFERNEVMGGQTIMPDEGPWSDEEGFDVVSSEINRSQESVESWTCYHHFKKFHIKFVLNEDIVKTAKKIMTEESSIER